MIGAVDPLVARLLAAVLMLASVQILLKVAASREAVALTEDSTFRALQKNLGDSSLVLWKAVAVVCYS